MKKLFHGLEVIMNYDQRTYKFSYDFETDEIWYDDDTDILDDETFVKEALIRLAAQLMFAYRIRPHDLEP